MYDFTKREWKKVEDNLTSYIANFGKPRIERDDYGKGFYVFTDDSGTYRQYCYNIDYLNGWLYGCVQARYGNPKRNEEFYYMMTDGDYRERFAVVHGEIEIKTIRGHKCYVFTYGTDVEYQDANGATYDPVTCEWIN